MVPRFPALLHRTRLRVLVAACVIEVAVGYPDAVWRRVGHPVSWMGRLIDGLETRLNDPVRPARIRRARGIASLAVLLGVTGSVARLAARETARLPLGCLLLPLLGSTLLATRSLHTHVAAVGAAADLAGARAALGRIVGRDTATLDAGGVRRAAIESLAENFSDGVVAPALFFALGGLRGAALYKAVNTADSMIGHRTERLEAFGWAAARLDDALNLPASRLAALLLALASGRPRAAWRAAWRDAPVHRSPNAGWPEAAMAEALGIRIGGPRSYGGETMALAWMGSGRAEVTAADFQRALRLYRRAAALGLLLLVLASVGRDRRWSEEGQGLCPWTPLRAVALRTRLFK